MRRRRGEERLRFFLAAADFVLADFVAPDFVAAGFAGVEAGPVVCFVGWAPGVGVAGVEL